MSIRKKILERATIQTVLEDLPARTPLKYPTLNFIREHRKEIDLVAAFLEFMCEHVKDYSPDDPRGCERIIADFFKISLEKKEEETEALIKSVQTSNGPVTQPLDIPTLL